MGFFSGGQQGSVNPRAGFGDFAGLMNLFGNPSQPDVPDPVRQPGQGLPGLQDEISRQQAIAQASGLPGLSEMMIRNIVQGQLENPPAPQTTGQPEGTDFAEGQKLNILELLNPKRQPTEDENLLPDRLEAMMEASKLLGIAKPPGADQRQSFLPAPVATRGNRPLPSVLNPAASSQPDPRVRRALGGLRGLF